MRYATLICASALLVLTVPPARALSPPGPITAPDSTGDQVIFYYDARENFTTFVTVRNESSSELTVDVLFYGASFSSPFSQATTIPPAGLAILDIAALKAQGLPDQSGVAIATAVDGSGAPVVTRALSGNFTVANLLGQSAWGAAGAARSAVDVTKAAPKPPALGTVIDGTKVALTPIQPTSADLAAYYNPETLAPVSESGNQLIFLAFEDVPGRPYTAKLGSTTWTVTAVRGTGTALEPATVVANGVAASDLASVVGSGVNGGSGAVSFSAPQSPAPLTRLIFFTETLGTFGTGYLLPSGNSDFVITPGSSRIALVGTFASSYSNGSLAADTTIDAHAASFLASPTNNYPLNLAGGAPISFSGGAVLGQFDRKSSWDHMHTLNSAGIAFENAQMTVDGLRIDDVSDGIRPQKGDAFTIRNVHLSYIRDNCVENDHLHAGLVDDSLFDGCYNGFSARPSPDIILGGANGAANMWHIQNSLVRLQPMPRPRASSPDHLGHDGFFKWDSWDDPTMSLSPKLTLDGNIFMAERVGQVGGARMGIPPGQLVSCSNNVMVWLGPGPFPAPLPECFTVTTDRAVWDNAVADWLQRHPQVAP